MSAITWLAIIIGGLVLLILAYYAILVFAKAVISLFPVILSLLIGGTIGWLIGGIIGGIIFFISIVIAFVSLDKWEGSDLYQKIENYFDKKTRI